MEEEGFLDTGKKYTAALESDVSFKQQPVLIWLIFDFF